MPRSILPIPEVERPGLTTCNAKDPDTKFQPIRTATRRRHGDDRRGVHGRST
jgi:hypothetical protein